MSKRESDLSIANSILVICGTRSVCTASFAILEEVRMRVLFGISILALIALLWASMAIARHVYQARQRHQRELQNEAVAESDGRRL